MRAPTCDSVKNGIVIIAAGDSSLTKPGPETDCNDRYWYLYPVHQSSQSEETLENLPSPEEIRNLL